MLCSSDATMVCPIIEDIFKINSEKKNLFMSLLKMFIVYVQYVKNILGSLNSYITHYNRVPVEKNK